MLRSILFALSFISVGAAIVLAVIYGLGAVILIAGSFAVALAASALPDDLRLPIRGKARGFILLST
jgi:hypothetical protein